MSATNELKKQLRKYGLTPEQYARMLDGQEGLCAICLKPPTGKRRLAVDHDHLTGFVRGLLCTSCNIGLGCFDHSTELLKDAIGYLVEARVLQNFKR